MAEQRSHTTMFRSAFGYHGTPHEQNGKPDNGGDAWYFSVQGPDDIGGRLTGYLTREQFNWVAERLGVPKVPVLDSLSDDERSQS